MDKENAVFWDELCGTQLANRLGIKDRSEKSLKVFDDYYFNMYPYLEKYIQFEKLKNKCVLEVGLGYGSVAQKIIESGAKYIGLDIAQGPVNMVNHRISTLNSSGQAVKGSILTPSFEPDSFDAIIAIGCLHHTGDLELAIKNCLNLLRGNGRLVFMVYYSYSYRRWMKSFVPTVKYFIDEFNGKRGVIEISDANQRGEYDFNEHGDAAPFTSWISRKSMRSLVGECSSLEMYLENIDGYIPIVRKKLLNTFIPKTVGLDLYVTLTK